MNFDVIGISKSHLDSTIPDVDVEFNNYSVFRLDRNRQGGGVALYVRSSLACVRRYDLENQILRCYGLRSHLTISVY